MPRLTNKKLINYAFDNPYTTIINYYNHKKTLQYKYSKIYSNGYLIAKFNLDNPNKIKDVNVIGCFDGIYENFFPIATARHIRLIIKIINEKNLPYRYVKEDQTPLLNTMGNCALTNINLEFLDDECSICLSDDLNNLVKTRCGHIFHRDCIKKWLDHKFECALCRTDLSIIKK